jgi:hypothetical protein
MRRDRLDQLLSRGRLGGPTAERVLDGALRQAGIVPPPWYRRRAVLFGSPVLVCAAAAAFVLIGRPAPDTMRSKGGSPGDSAVVSVECGGRAPGTCGREDLILFRVEAVARQGFLAAYAEPAIGGERIWFFPQADGSAPVVAAGTGPQVLREAVAARSMSPGHYQVHIVITGRPVSKQEILAGAGADVIAVRTTPLEVTP